MANIIELSNLTKTYGKSRGINNISLKVEQGSVFGFLGPNGAGKTTTISLLIDLIKPTSGKAMLFGEDANKHGVAMRQNIGYLSSDMALEASFTGWQNLEFFGHIRGVFDKKYITSLAKNLECDLNRKTKNLSRGNKQKIGLISALMHKPRLLILDEPTSGLDPLIQEQFHEIIRQNKKDGKTTFISSHILSEVQELCDNVAFIKDGNLIANEPIDEISKNSPYTVELTCNDTKLAKGLKSLSQITNLVTYQNQLSFNFKGPINQLLSFINNYQISDIQIKKADLESVFMHYYKD